MGYIDQSLTTGEVVHYRTRLHWTVLFGPLAIGIAFAAGAISLVVVAVRRGGNGAIDPLVISSVACALAAGVALVVGLLRRSSTEIAVTNRRVLMKSGILGRRTVELMLSKVESIAVNQALMGRMVGYGTVVVRGTGGTYEVFNRVAAPLEFRRQVQEQINRVHPPSTC